MFNIDLKKLRAFQMVERHGGLRGAAESLHITTSAVSFQIKHLEDELGVKLFDRVNKKFILTPRGREFLEDVDRILAEVDQAVSALVDAKKPQARLSLGLGFDLTGHFARPLAGFMKSNPRVELSLRLRPARDILRYMLDGEIDLGVAHFEQLPRQFIKRPLAKSGLLALCLTDHPLASVRRLTVPHLAQHAIVLPRQDNNMGRRIVGRLADFGLKPASVIEAGSCQSSYNLAKEGIGVAIIHTTCLSSQPSRRLKILDVTEHFGEIGIVLAYPKTLKLTPNHQDLMKVLERSARS
jgi:DNA-binding transcriptional LysR family regulator